MKFRGGEFSPGTIGNFQWELTKTRKLLAFEPAKNAKNGQIASNWNVSGTRAFIFHPSL